MVDEMTNQAWLTHCVVTNEKSWLNICLKTELKKYHVLQYEIKKYFVSKLKSKNKSLTFLNSKNDANYKEKFASRTFAAWSGKASPLF